MITCSSTLRHRGPDWSGYEIKKGDTEGTVSGIGHERLAIMDPDSGAQPFTSEDGKITIAANGEIYNFKELYTSEVPDYKPQTGSDCEVRINEERSDRNTRRYHITNKPSMLSRPQVLLPLYKKYSKTPALADKLRGMFSFILHDSETNEFVVVRDHIGITPLYIGWGNDGSVWLASEMKAIVKHCVR